jgi:tetratricopeptide (TPR) repeat protein
LIAAVAISREIGDRSGEFIGLATLADVHRLQGRKGESEEHFAAAIALANEIGNPRFQGIHCSIRRPPPATRAFGRRRRQSTKRRWLLAVRSTTAAAEAAALSKLGALLVEQRQLAEARPLYEQALALARDTNQRVLEGEVLGNLGDLLAKEGQLSEAIEALPDGRSASAQRRQSRGTREDPLYSGTRGRQCR